MMKFVLVALALVALAFGASIDDADVSDECKAVINDQGDVFEECTNFGDVLMGGAETESEIAAQVASVEGFCATGGCGERLETLLDAVEANCLSTPASRVAFFAFLDENMVSRDVVGRTRLGAKLLCSKNGDDFCALEALESYRALEDADIGAMIEDGNFRDFFDLAATWTDDGPIPDICGDSCGTKFARAACALERRFVEFQPDEADEDPLSNSLQNRDTPCGVAKELTTVCRKCADGTFAVPQAAVYWDGLRDAMDMAAPEGTPAASIDVSAVFKPTLDTACNDPNRACLRRTLNRAAIFGLLNDLLYPEDGGGTQERLILFAANFGCVKRDNGDYCIPAMLSAIFENSDEFGGTKPPCDFDSDTPTCTDECRAWFTDLLDNKLGCCTRGIPGVFALLQDSPNPFHRAAAAADVRRSFRKISQACEIPLPEICPLVGEKLSLRYQAIFRPGVARALAEAALRSAFDEAVSEAGYVPGSGELFRENTSVKRDGSTELTYATDNDVGSVDLDDIQVNIQAGFLQTDSNGGFVITEAGSEEELNSTASARFSPIAFAAALVAVFAALL